MKFSDSPVRSPILKNFNKAPQILRSSDGNDSFCLPPVLQDFRGDTENVEKKTKDASMELHGDFSKGGREALSPGAGLDSADEQADAALADLMFTSMNVDETVQFLPPCNQ